MPWIEIWVALGIGIPISIPIPISSMAHPNRPGCLADAVRWMSPRPSTPFRLILHFLKSPRMRQGKARRTGNCSLDCQAL